MKTLISIDNIVDMNSGPSAVQNTNLLVSVSKIIDSVYWYFSLFTIKIQYFNKLHLI